jgi:hypothetical protein
VSYRIQRYNALLEEAAEFLYAIDPGLKLHREAEHALRHARHAAAVLEAPAKRRRRPSLDC